VRSCTCCSGSPPPFASSKPQARVSCKIVKHFCVRNKIDMTLTPTESAGEYTVETVCYDRAISLAWPGVCTENSDSDVVVMQSAERACEMMLPVRWTGREMGASLSNDRCVLISL
jgi:hypothetical protein